jgi:hypothetical protein
LGIGDWPNPQSPIPILNNFKIKFCIYYGLTKYN